MVYCLRSRQFQYQSISEYLLSICYVASSAVKTGSVSKTRHDPWLRGFPNLGEM